MAKTPSQRAAAAALPTDLHLADALADQPELKARLTAWQALHPAAADQVSDDVCEATIIPISLGWQHASPALAADDGTVPQALLERFYRPVGPVALPDAIARSDDMELSIGWQLLDDGVLIITGTVPTECQITAVGLENGSQATWDDTDGEWIIDPPPGGIPALFAALEHPLLITIGTPTGTHTIQVS